MTSSALDALPAPPCAVLLGWDLVEVKPESGWIRIAFDGKREFCNPAGFIQGGFLAAMLDDTMGPAVFAKTHGEWYTATIDMNVSYLAPAKVGKLFGEATVVQLGKTIAFLEAKLMDEAGTLIARATSTARLVATAKIIR
ncbi:MAG TPA: PaaI family thioesterase [Steroidobacteraceae bacterium]|nr:PaaI family thioesterase [Steroidobacteraceae bacterium]